MGPHPNISFIGSTYLLYDNGDSSDATANPRIIYGNMTTLRSSVDLEERPPPITHSRGFDPPRKREPRFVQPRFHFQDYRPKPPRNMPR